MNHINYFDNCSPISFEFVEKPCTNFIFCTFPEKDGSSSEEQSESDEEDGFKNSSNKIGEEISVTDLLEKAKQQEFKVCFKYASFLSLITQPIWNTVPFHIQAQCKTGYLIVCVQQEM